jgi:hypothetical protein
MSTEPRLKSTKSIPTGVRDILSRNDKKLKPRKFNQKSLFVNSLPHEKNGFKHS